MIINHNMNAMNAHRLMMGNTNQAGKSMEKLSSGLRINRAGDDAAGLAISEKMRAQIRGLDQASRNSQDGISMIQTAEGALNETHSILQRMRELATQSANDTNVEVDRGEIQKEMNQLTSEINRIGNTTEFNTQSVLKGKDSVGQLEDVKNAVGTAGTKGKTSFEITTALAKDDTLDVGGKTITVYADAAAITTAGDANGIALDTADTAEKQAAAIAALFTGDVTGAASGAEVTLTQAVAGTGDVAAVAGAAVAKVTAGTDVAGVAATVDKESTEFTITKGLGEGETLSVGGKDIVAYNKEGYDKLSDDEKKSAIDVESNDTAEKQAAAIADLFAKDAEVDVKADGAKVTLTQAAAGIGNVDEPEIIPEGGKDFTATLQIGANNGQAFEIEIKDMRSVALGISGKAEGTVKAQRDGYAAVDKAQYAGNKDGSKNVTSGTDNVGAEYALDVSGHDEASAAIKVINNAIEMTSAERSKLGAYQNRLEHTINNLGTASENLTASESRVRDVDMANEMMTFSKKNILSQAAQAMLAQANQQPQGVLQLLR